MNTIFTKVKPYFLFLILSIATEQLSAQNVGVNVTGATPDVSAMLDIATANKGLLIPRISLVSTTDGATIATPATSLLVYNTNAGMTNGQGVGYYYNSGTTVAPLWIKLSTTSEAWLLKGNATITTPAVPATYGTTQIAATENFLGTTDGNDVVIGTNNTERVRVKQTTGNIGIGTASPAYKLDIVAPGNTIGIRILSGNTAQLSYLSLGRNTEYAQIGACTAGTFFLDAATGDMAIKNYNTGKILLGASFSANADMALITNGNVGIHTVTPGTIFDVKGNNNWNTGTGEGDVRIGDPTYRLKIGVANGGAGAGDVRITAGGGTNRIFLGGSTNTTTLTVDGTNNRIGIRNNAILPNSALDIDGDLALREGAAIAVAAGANALTLVGEYSHYRLTGAGGAFALNTIAGGNDGQIITLINAATQVMTINNNNAANGILTGTSGNLISTGTGNSSVTMIYNATLARWVVTSSSGMIVSNDWHVTGNALISTPAAPATYGTTPIAATENWAGTTDGNDYVIGTNFIERLRVKQTTGNVGIGIAAPSYKLHVVDPASFATAASSENTYVGTADGTGIYGRSNNNPYYGYGGRFDGGYMGVNGSATTSGTGYRYGGYFTGWYGATTNYGVYGYGYGGVNAYGVYGTSGGGSTQSTGGYFSGSNYGVTVPSGGGLNGFGTTTPSYLVDVIGAGGSNIHVRNNGRYWSNSANGGMWLSDLTDCFVGNISTTQFGFWSSTVGWNALNINKTTNQVAIGTTAPAASRLEVADANTNPVLVARIRNGNSQGTQIGLGSIELSQDWQASLDWQESVSVYYGATPSYDLQMGANSAAKPTNGSWTVPSDQRLKDDVHPFKDGLAVLRNIKPVYFHYNGKAKTPDEYGIGVIAQQVKEVAPYMISTFQYSPTEKKDNIEEYYSYNPDALHYITLNAVKELDAKVQAIEENVSDFGVTTLNKEETFVSFNKSFTSKINKGEEPVVTATLLGKSDVVVNIISQNSEGFVVRISDALASVKINWIAMAKAAKISVPDENYTDGERKEMLSKVKLVKGEIIDNFEKEETAMKLRKDETDSKKSVDGFNADIKSSSEAQIKFDVAAKKSLKEEQDKLAKERYMKSQESIKK